MSSSHIVRISSIRSNNPMGRGGAIFYGAIVGAPSGTDTGGLVVLASGQQLGEACIDVGQMWRVQGEPEPRTRTLNGFNVVERQVIAKSLEMVLPVGEQLVAFLADGTRFQGLSSGKARSLWETFGERLYELLDGGDAAEIASANRVGFETAQAAVVAWRQYGEQRLLHWLHARGVSFTVGRRVVRYFGPDVRTALSTDPYRLLSFGATWAATEAVARELVAIKGDDPRRLCGAVEEVLYRAYGDGHTLETLEGIARPLGLLLDMPSKEALRRAFGEETLAYARKNGTYILTYSSYVQHVGAYAMETAVASAFAARLLADKGSPSSLLEPRTIESILAAYETQEGIELNAEQRAAVHATATNRLAVITGGAGVGKTTVLKAINLMLDAAQVRVYQCALAGRAAQRMKEATGKPARTIASLVLSLKEKDFDGPCAVVVDEASMVDLFTMYRLCALLPSHVRLLLLGDPYQLMPVGPGLVLHSLVNQSGVSVTELKVGKRFGAAIAGIAHQVRRGDWQRLPEEPEAAVAFLRRPSIASNGVGQPAKSIADTVVELYLQAPEKTQILAPRRSGPEGVKSLNELCQKACTTRASELQVWNAQFSSFAGTGFRLGDPVVATRNLWDVGLQNGSLGRIVEVLAPNRAHDEHASPALGSALGWIEWDDGRRRPVTLELLKDLELAYALTVHKAQGSQWERVIVPITSTWLLERTLIYTAITRARTQVILVGDESAACTAVDRPPRFDSRQTFLRHHLSRLLRAG